MERLQKQLELIRRGTAEIFPEEELIAKLERAIETGKPLRVKLGIDPSTKDIHLGHTVVLHKLRQFQELGHKAILIIGDGTGLVGDPSGRDKTRPQLTPEEIEENARTYLEQVKKILLMDKGKLEIVRNGDWFRKMPFFEVIRLASRITVARVLERDDFAERYKKKVPISLHELIYPVMQGWDSVMVKSDIELGGTDQKYNLLVGRDLQRDSGQEPQICITLPLLVGTDGKQKMSKSYDNYIGVTENPKTMFDKALSIPDSLVRDYFVLLTEAPLDEVDKQTAGDCPVELFDVHVPPRAIYTRLNLREYLPSNSGILPVKLRLAYLIVRQYHGREVADTLLILYLQEQERKVQKERLWKKVKEDVKKGVMKTLKRRKELRRAGATLLEADLAQKVVISASDLKDGRIWVVKLVGKTGFVKSNSQARQKILEGAVTLNGEKITDPESEVPVKEGDIVKVGKKRLAVVTIETADKRG